MSLTNFKNYYYYGDMVRDNSEKIVYVPKDIDMNNINDHIDGITNIFKDGIETDFVHNAKITVSWGGDLQCKLSLVDYWYNLFMWSMLLKVNTEIKPKNVFWSSELKRNNIKNFIDKFICNKYNKIHIRNGALNNIICDGIWNFSNIEQFSYYLANTINNEDDIALMNACPEFYDLLHCSMANVPFGEVKDVGMKMTDRAIDIIKDSEKYIGYEHSLANSFRASEAINPRQFKEVSINIGTKPNSNGGVYPYVIDKSFKTGGVDTPLSYLIESSTARAAQIMSKTNVGESGDFARLLGLNNTDTILNQDPEYHCLSQHFIRFHIKTQRHLTMIKDRCYRLNPRGMEFIVDDKDTSLINKVVYLRSPMTCASNSNGTGICISCYGELYWTNRDINIGKIAAEILSAQLTQTLLSAKHLLETRIKKIQWNTEFKDFFTIDTNAIKLNDDLDQLKGFSIIIDPEEIELVNEDDYSSNYDDDGEEYINVTDDDEIYNEYITKFIIKTPTGAEIECCSQDVENPDPMYISKEFNNVIRKKSHNSENKIVVPLTALEDIILFFIKINNNEISKTMDMIIHVINKSNVTKNKTKDEALQSIVDLVVEGNLTIDAIHLEVILSNQIVSNDDILKRPNWNDPSAQYRMCTLNESLTNNRSIIVSLLYKDLGKTLYNPLSFSKRGPSFFDIFYHEQPQNYISDELLTDEPNIKDPDKKVVMARIVNKEEEK